MEYYVYIITNRNNTTLYIGMTNNLERRIYEHKNHLMDGFSNKYNLEKLIYYEISNNVEFVIEREKQLKKWSRKKKENLINTMNPDWIDLSKEWYES
ncbi:GIY-YIG nuclease family protein [Peptoniphilus mikwangii]|uniref:GIY-YIG nuclease family protein n=1 Tax=Peptoniphilus mikwangii TaxID=1354300 RepID=UPI00041AFC79|nr:GIY-YIG nuclease family protein [Peptoniphilus mikwangii]